MSFTLYSSVSVGCESLFGGRPCLILLSREHIFSRRSDTMRIEPKHPCIFCCLCFDYTKSAARQKYPRCWTLFIFARPDRSSHLPLLALIVYIIVYIKELRQCLLCIMARVLIFVSSRYVQGWRKGPTTRVYCTQSYLIFLPEAASKG